MYLDTLVKFVKKTPNSIRETIVLLQNQQDNYVKFFEMDPPPIVSILKKTSTYSKNKSYLISMYYYLSLIFLRFLFP